MFQRSFVVILLAFSLSISACGESGEQSSAPSSDAPSASAQQSPGSDLSPAQIVNGIGPITASIELGEIDRTLGAEGAGIFKIKCTACHKMDKRYIGPPLANILDSRSPAYVMNMILNPEEMTQKHPEAKKLLAEYIAPMANQNLTEHEARAVLEYIRVAADSLAN